VKRVVVVLLAAGACSDSPAVTPDAPPDAEVLPSVMPDRLSETGLYIDIGAKTLSPRLVEFTPLNVLWSDGAEKHRWYQLPPGATIDSTDMDHWKFPVGTKFFKEFARDGKRLETRLIWRVADTGNREADTLFGSFVWDENESDAVFVKDGQMDVRGTDHDAPAADTCWRCHVGEAGRALGFSALQLGDVSGLPLSSPPPAGTTYAAPNPALGYLHANCGHCHNPNGGAWVDSHMILRLDVDERDATANQIVQSTVGVELQQWIGHGYTHRIVAGDPDNSAVFYRMTQRTMNVQMPPIATEHTDDAGIALIRTWIQSL
jgi:hypothetical protein